MYVLDSNPESHNKGDQLAGDGQVERTRHFAPVKNAPGAKNDTPATAREAFMALGKRCSTCS